MAKEEFEVSQTKQRDETKFTEEGKKKLRTLTFKGVNDEGIVTTFTVKGPIEIMEKRFTTFPIAGSSMVAIIQTKTETLTQNLENFVVENPEEVKKLEEEEEKEIENAILEEIDELGA